jgi:hypothetical protein
MLPPSLYSILLFVFAFPTLTFVVGSTTIIAGSAETAIDFLEECLPLMADRFLSRFYGEPWCFLTMCAAMMLLKIHVGQESWQTAKAFCARRFLDLHYKHAGRQQKSPPGQQELTMQHTVTPSKVSMLLFLSNTLYQHDGNTMDELWSPLHFDILA